MRGAPTASFAFSNFTASKTPFLLPPLNPSPAYQCQAAATSSSSTPSFRRSAPLLRCSACPPPPPMSADYNFFDRLQQQHKDLLVDAFHANSALRALLEEISRDGSRALDLLARDGDWTSDLLWPVLSYLVDSRRGDEALQVFGLWKSTEMTRANVLNYLRIIKLLSEGGLMKEAICLFQEMKKHGLVPSSTIYNAIIHGFARKEEFDKSNVYLSLMMESGLLPRPETYNGILQAFGRYKMYDEMSKCVKRMESDGCFPDEITYNILITEFAHGGLLDRMEQMYRVLVSKRMKLRSSTLVSILEAYADIGLLEKMERVYSRVLNSKAYITESLIRKLAVVYIKNHKFSCLEDLGNDLSARYGRTDLVWYLLLLSSVCLLSKKGILSIFHEMQVAKVRLNITYTNILAFFYFKMRDFRLLDDVFYQAGKKNIKPDIMTYGILFDACKIGYDGTHILEEWKKIGYLESVVELKTDRLVLAAFGKGFFLTKCEKIYSSLQSRTKDKKLWRYCDFLGLVFG